MKKRPIFLKLMIPMMGLLILEILILVSGIFGTGILEKLTENEREIIHEKVSARSSYLQNLMVDNWMNVDYTVNSINKKTEELLDKGILSLDTLDDSSGDSMPLLMEATDYLISMMNSNHVSGAFLILNTDNLIKDVASGEYNDKPGIYLRSSDPFSQVSKQYGNLLAERAPISVVQKFGIAADSGWQLNFGFKRTQVEYYDFFYNTFQTAYDTMEEYRWKDMGYWSAPYQLEGDGKTAIAYSVPLILDSGKIYGVLGIDITLDYFSRLVPFNEIADDTQGAYFLAKQATEEGVFYDVFGDGNINWREALYKDGLKLDTSEYYYDAVSLKIYDSNTPYGSDNWVVTGIVPMHKLSGFTKEVESSLGLAIIATLIIGIVGSIFVSLRIRRPVAKLSGEMKNQNPRDQIELHDTGIREIDQMSEVLEQLSRDILESDMKFTKIIRMASMKIAGFQIDRNGETLFVTNNFFEIFGYPEIDTRNMSLQEFNYRIELLHRYFVEKNEITDSYVYRIPDNGSERYVQLKYMETEGSCYGICEDVTQTFLERRILQHERDHDALTGLYNRRAFWRELQNLFQSRERDIRVGALLMLDLDNLKHINDTYGHSYGDQYIVLAANTLRQFLPKTALYARISGDEFNIFIYGFDNRQVIEEQIDNLRQGIKTMAVMLPDNTQSYLQVSGGVAWYPDDSSQMDELFRYADNAMYAVKKKKKGEIRNFNIHDYKNQNLAERTRDALSRLIDGRQVRYAFQPIVDAHTGSIFAYEALMRPYQSELGTVGEVLDVARREGCLDSIEELTWFESMKAFDEHVRAGRISPESRLFLNTIPNQRMEQLREQEFNEKYGKYMKQLVLELTEEERIDRAQWEDKQKRHRLLGGRIAMDDYGAGYNGEKMLLAISPDYIKVDIAIVNRIHQSADKQDIVSYIVNYAHERGKFIIAEGVETEEEMRTLIHLGVDYLQGFFLARPQIEPEGVSQRAIQVIREENH